MGSAFFSLLPFPTFSFCLTFLFWLILVERKEVQDLKAAPTFFMVWTQSVSTNKRKCCGSTRSQEETWAQPRPVGSKCPARQQRHLRPQLPRPIPTQVRIFPCKASSVAMNLWQCVHCWTVAACGALASLILLFFPFLAFLLWLMSQDSPSLCHGTMQLKVTSYKGCKILGKNYLGMLFICDKRHICNIIKIQELSVDDLDNSVSKEFIVSELIVIGLTLLN